MNKLIVRPIDDSRYSQSSQVDYVIECMRYGLTHNQSMADTIQSIAESIESNPLGIWMGYPDEQSYINAIVNGDL